MEADSGVEPVPSAGRPGGRAPAMESGRAVAWVLCVVSLGFGAFGLDRSPVVWADEVMVADMARSLAFEGRLAAPAYGDFLGLADVSHVQSPLHVLVLAAGYALFGVSIWATRLPGVLWHAAAIWVVCRIGRLLPSRKGFCIWPGLVAVALFAFDHGLIARSRSGRADSLAILLTLLGIYSAVRPVPLGRSRYFVPGFLFGGASLAHPET